MGLRHGLLTPYPNEWSVPLLVLRFTPPNLTLGDSQEGIVLFSATSPSRFGGKGRGSEGALSYTV
jgi:hypothetical protein